MEVVMSSTSRLAAVAVLVATSALSAAAQGPTMPSVIPVQAPILTPTPAAPAPTTPIVAIPSGRSTWRSQDGSVLELTIDQSAGTLTGTFVPGFPCGLSNALTPARPIAGTVSGNAVAWALSLPACPSVGTWIGHFQTVDGAEQLAVLWTLAVTESPPGVGSTLTGSALFVRQTSP